MSPSGRSSKDFTSPVSIPRPEVRRSVEFDMEERVFELTDRGVSNDGDPELSTGGSRAVSEDIGSPDGELLLNTRYWVHSVCGANGLLADFAKHVATDLALLDECGKGLHGVLDGDVGVHTGQLEKVDLLAWAEQLDAVVNTGPDSSLRVVRGEGGRAEATCSRLVRSLERCRGRS